MKTGSISVVVPMYNEKENAKNTINQLERYLSGLGIEWEIIAVDDGSSDGTGKILDSLKSRSVKVFHHKKNMGQAAALKTGFSNAKGDVVLTIDSDLSFLLDNIEKILRKAGSSDADVLIGTYYRKNHYKNVPKTRILIGKIGNFIYRIAFPVKLKQYTCNFRLYKNHIAKEIEFDEKSRFVGKVEIILDLVRKGRKIEQVYVTLVSRKKGKSKFRFSDIFRHLRFFFEILKMRVCGKLK